MDIWFKVMGKSWKPIGKMCKNPELSNTATPPQIYTYEMKIIKAKVGHAGVYRCEVTVKDKCDSSSFEISVEGEWKRTPARHRFQTR